MNALNDEIKKIEDLLKDLRKIIKGVYYIQPDFIAVFYRDLKTILGRLNTILEEFKKYGTKEKK